MVQGLQPPIEVSDESDVTNTYFKNPFGVYQRGRPFMQKNEPRLEYIIKIAILEFQGSLNPDEFVDWLNTIERICYHYDVSEERKVKLVSIHLQGRHLLSGLTGAIEISLGWTTGIPR